MKKFFLTAAVAAVTLTSFASMAEAHHRRHWHHGWGPGFGIVIGSPRVVYADPYYGCIVKKKAHYNRWGELVIKKVKICG